MEPDFLQNGIKITPGGAPVEVARTKSAKKQPPRGLPEQSGRQRPPLRRFGASFWDQTVPKGVQKSHIFKKKQNRMLKNWVQEGISKNHAFGMEFWWNFEASGPLIFGPCLGNMHVFRKLMFREKASKIRGKGCKNDSQIRLWAHMGSDFYDFGRLFAVSDFCSNFDRSKMLEKCEN